MQWRRGIMSRQDAVTLFAAVVAALLYPWIPALLWCVPFALAVILAVEVMRGVGRREGVIVAACCAGAMLLYVMVLVVFGLHDPMKSRLDDYDYFIKAREISKAWKSGFFPELTRKGSLPYLGTLHTGFERVLSTAFYLTGAKVGAGILVQFACIALLPLFAFAAASQLFADEPREVSLCAAGLAALHPAWYFWASWLLKDLFLTLVFTAALFLFCRFVRTKRFLVAIAFAGMWLILGITRAYAALALACGILAYGIALLPRKAVWWTALYGGLIFLAVTYSTSAGNYLSQLSYSFSMQLPMRASTSTGALAFVASGVPRVFFAPYAWIKAFGEQPLYGAYPGMWFLYLVIYPLSLAGCVRAMRIDHRLSVVPFTAVFLSAMILLVSYGGDAPRQRLYLELVLILYAAFGLRAKRLWLYGLAVWVPLILFAALQYATLHLRYGSMP